MEEEEETRSAQKKLSYWFINVLLYLEESVLFVCLSCLFKLEGDLGRSHSLQISLHYS